MGLVFPLQLDLRRSRPTKLLLSSTTKRFTVGSSFLFIGLVLAAMYLAAAPLFDIMWNQGALFDQMLAAFFYGLMIAYPIICIGCFGYKSVVILDRSGEKIQIKAEKGWGPIKWSRASYSISSLGDLEVVNWKGAVNVAGISAQERGKQDRYATRGHWILKVKGEEKSELERRANREDVDWLMGQIEAFFTYNPA